MSSKDLNELVVDYIPLAYKMANKYKGRGIAVEELREVALDGLLDARRYWNPKKGGFGTAAHMTIQSALTNQFSCQSNRFNLYADSEPIASSGDIYKEDGTMYHIVEDERMSPIKVLEEKRRIQLADELITNLPARYRFVIENRYLNTNLLTLRELADMMDISIERVRQLENKAIKRMKEDAANVYSD